jgi:Domain of unknown function (DUF4192)
VRTGPQVCGPGDGGGMSTSLTARGPEDLIAAVPVVLGFRPEDSLVMLTFEARRTFHARVDLPGAADLDDELPELAEALVRPCRTHGVGRVAFVVYGDDPALASALACGLESAFERARIGVLAVLRAHRGLWWHVGKRPGEPEVGPSPYDDESHPFTAQAVFEGRVTHASRDALRATVAPVTEDRRAGLADRIAALPPPGPGAARVLLDVVGRCVDSRADPDEHEAAAVLVAVGRLEARDAALYAVSRRTAGDHLRVWSSLLRRAPDEQVPDVAAVTAFCAWQAGDGALAWCALDRCFEVDADHRLGTGLAECLTRAVPPSTWQEVVAESDPPGPEAASA